MQFSSALLLKLSVAAATGVIALLSFRRLRRHELLSSLRRDIRDALLLLDATGNATPPPAILVTGFRSHGKSSFINTVCRALADEVGPILLLRAETAPPGPTPGTVARHVIRAEVAGGEEGEEAAEVELVDGTGLPEAARITRADTEAVVVGVPPPECVVVVVRCGAPSKERQLAVRKLTDIATVIREKGLHLVVVLTQKKALKTKKQAEEIRREVAFRARTDCVYFIENYTASNSSLSARHPTATKNDFETSLTALAIIRQCAEFVKMHRSHSSRIASTTLASTENNKLVLLKE